MNEVKFMNVLDGIMNFLKFVNDNWTAIVVIIALAISIVRKVKDLFTKSNDEKIAVAKKQIKETMLRLVTEAECDYDAWTKAGAVKRAQVIEEIFLTYPILSTVTNQEELISWIDDVINESLDTMRDIISENKATE
jgi:hypothetical protein